jgi:hypothetical protein
MRRLIGSLAIWVLLVMGTFPAHAVDGLMSSISFLNIPANASLQVLPYDDSDDNIAIQRVFEKNLRQRGYKISSDAKLILNFETRDEIGSWSGTDRRHLLSFEAKGGRGGGEDARARLNFFDSNSGGLINKGKGGTSIATPSSYRIEASIENRSTGKRLWQGWSEGKLGAGNGQSLTLKMVPVLVEGIGKTISQRTFELY